MPQSVALLSASFLAACLLPLHTFAAAEGIPRDFPRKKLIAAGWDSPSPEFLLEHLKTIEALPFDGIRISLAVPIPSGGEADFYRMFQPQKWERDWFIDSIETLKKAHSEKLTDNLLSVGSGSTIDWFDDEAWKEVVEHFRIAAWVAKKGGLKGLLFNPEVGVRLPAFSYNQQLSKEKHSFAEYAAKVRERGRAVMQAMADEYPDMVFLCMFFNGGQAHNPFYQMGGQGGRLPNWYFQDNQLKPAGPAGPMEVQEQGAPLERIEGGSYNLLPAFLNGLLDTVPPEMRIVDGLEQTYVTTERADFVRWAYNVSSAALPLVAPENRAKYKAQVEVGFGIYLDAYTNPSGSRHFADSKKEGRSRVEQLEESVRTALEVSEGYVWLWGEKHWWWPSPMKRLQPESWEEKAPGITQALADACDPSQKALRAYREAHTKWTAQESKTDQNLLPNGDFSIADLGAWEAGAPNSFFQHDAAGSIHLSGGPIAVVQSALPVPKSRGIFGVRARVRSEGSSKASLRIRWKKDESPFLLTASDAIRLVPNHQPDANGWQMIEAIVSVPPRQNRLILQCVHTEGEAPGGSAWFDDIEVYRLDH